MHQKSKDFLPFISAEQKVVEEEPPAKLLDDLFCKTKAVPCIYWLPLTEEQVSIVTLAAEIDVFGNVIAKVLRLPRE